MLTRLLTTKAACLLAICATVVPGAAENGAALDATSVLQNVEFTAELSDYLVMDAEMVAEIRSAYLDRDVIHNRLVATQAITVSADQAAGNAFYIDMARVTIEVLEKRGHNVASLRADYVSEYDRYLAAN